MDASLRSLLEGVIDYAGLFPPAKLDMPRAVANYSRYTRGRASWIVSRFVCPSTRLQELVATLDAHEGAPIPLTVIGHVSQDLDEWEEGLERDVKAINAFFQSAEDRADIEAFEVRLPSHLQTDQCIRDLRGLDGLDVFVELPWGEGMDDSLAALAQSEWLGAKARTGGLEANAFPAAAELAGFLKGVVSLDLSFKLTAGLHHPFPTIDSDTGARMHGFINVLAAAGFAITHDLNRKEIEEVLLSDAADDWVFTDETIEWQDFDMNVEQIEDARSFFESIGSCSVEEVLADLDVLGLTSGGL